MSKEVARLHFYLPFSWHSTIPSPYWPVKGVLMPLSTRSLVLVGSSLIASVSSAQVIATFSNVLADGVLGSPNNTVLQYTFAQDFQWSGQLTINGVLLPSGGGQTINAYPRGEIITQSSGTTLSAVGNVLASAGFFMSSAFSTPANSNVVTNEAYRPLGLRNTSRNMRGETLLIRLGSVPTLFPPASPTWQSLSLTFLPYTPPAPPVTRSGTFVNNAGTFNILGDTIRINARTSRLADGTLNAPAIMALFNPLGELVTRWQSTREGATIEVPRTMNGDYYLAYGSTSSFWGDRFYHEDQDLINLTGATISINNDPFSIGGTGGSSNEEWTKFTVVPAPASAALFVALPLLARRRRAH
jgi:hypothetical protein